MPGRNTPQSSNCTSPKCGKCSMRWIRRHSASAISTPTPWPTSSTGAGKHPRASRLASWSSSAANRRRRKPPTLLGDAVHGYFRERAAATRRQLRQLFRVGRISLLIGLAFLALVIGVGEYLTLRIDKESYGYLVKESLIIAGWVALWRPLEIFLYDWWPIRAEARLLDRLSEMSVRVVGTHGRGARRMKTPTTLPSLDAAHRGVARRGLSRDSGSSFCQVQSRRPRGRGLRRDRRDVGEPAPAAARARAPAIRVLLALMPHFLWQSRAGRHRRRAPRVRAVAAARPRFRELPARFCRPGSRAIRSPRSRACCPDRYRRAKTKACWSITASTSKQPVVGSALRGGAPARQGADCGPTACLSSCSRRRGVRPGHGGGRARPHIARARAMRTA